MIKICPRCSSSAVKKNGHAKSSGKQNNYCNSCHRNFVDNPKKKYITEEIKTQIRKSFLERPSYRGICRIFDVSMSWLMNFFIKETDNMPSNLNFNEGLVHELNELDNNKDPVIYIQVDELCSHVKRRKDKVWVWIAIDNETKMIIAFYVGDRSNKSCKKLWNNIPESYRKNLYAFTDHYACYKSVIPAKQHCPVDKGTGLTNTVERFNNVLRQRLSRLVRETLSFSKIKENLVRSIHYFILDYNNRRQLMLFERFTE